MESDTRVSEKAGYVCVQCGKQVERLWEFRLGDQWREMDRIRQPLSDAQLAFLECKQCLRIADNYLEHDYLLIFIDCLLLRPGAIRHLLFNRRAAARVLPIPSYSLLSVLAVSLVACAVGLQEEVMVRDRLTENALAVTLVGCGVFCAACLCLPVGLRLLVSSQVVPLLELSRFAALLVICESLKALLLLQYVWQYDPIALSLGIVTFSRMLLVVCNVVALRVNRPTATVLVISAMLCRAAVLVGLFGSANYLALAL
mmetsp:Transcript_25949/g.72659  ORF Transcript_25949/g.72659 Transcript_25949/m.72659 type:complete len:257 (+) Transcript_25949:189-959(+)|eukprot:CAMPEP_0119146746 /NCGR_PEP_ID=MMETSP1310-20130426/39354_1 /TAXON_ID=464262 /ORGANISM="Genus nov. species nov., Strain RCC2339" /LENGTH=256 /DNA_ID=CAMNT_0007138659 /DNA_START=158 /DNA_END=928 /DNA_ORIENTATION=-